MVDRTKLSVDIQFSNPKEAEEFANYLSELANQEAPSKFTSESKMGVLVSIQATADPNRPNWEEEFYLKCSLKAQEISRQRERKVKEATDTEKKHMETHLQNLQTTAGMFSLYQMSKSPKSVLPPGVSSPDYSPSEVPKFIIHTGDDTQNTDTVMKSINAVLTGSMGSGAENIQIKGNTAIINELKVDLLLQVKGLARSMGSLEIEKMADDLLAEVSPETSISPSLKVADDFSKKLLEESRKEARAQIEQEKKQEAKETQQAFKKMGIDVSEKNATKTAKGMSILGRGMSFLKEVSMHGVMGAILGGTSLAADAAVEASGPSREDILTSQIMRNKMRTLQRPKILKDKVDSTEHRTRRPET